MPDAAAPARRRAELPPQWRPPGGLLQRRRAGRGGERLHCQWLAAARLPEGLLDWPAGQDRGPVELAGQVSSGPSCCCDSTDAVQRLAISATLQTPAHVHNIRPPPLCRSIRAPTASGGYNGWASGFPRAASNQLCGFANTTGSSPGYDWNNADCTMHMVFMCRIVREWRSLPRPPRQPPHCAALPAHIHRPVARPHARKRYIPLTAMLRSSAPRAQPPAPTPTWTAAATPSWSTPGAPLSRRRSNSAWTGAATWPPTTPWTSSPRWSWRSSPRWAAAQGGKRRRAAPEGSAVAAPCRACP
jgi:hypothetical protein